MERTWTEWVVVEVDERGNHRPTASTRSTKKDGLRTLREWQRTEKDAKYVLVERTITERVLEPEEPE